MTPTTTPSVHGSVTERPWSWVARKRVSAKLPNKPIRTPAETNARPLLNIIELLQRGLFEAHSGGPSVTWICADKS
jgi:hypothetical protein